MKETELTHQEMQGVKGGKRKPDRPYDFREEIARIQNCARNPSSPFCRPPQPKPYPRPRIPRFQ